MLSLVSKVKNINVKSTRFAIFVVGFALFGAVALLLTFAATSCGPDERDQVARINQRRSQIGVQQLPRSSCLTNAARAWSQNMANRGVLYHSRSNPDDTSNPEGGDW